MPKTIIMLSSRIPALIFVVAALICLKPNTAKSQANPEGGDNFGIGLMVGEPTGFTVKSWNGDQTAIGIGAAWSLAESEAIHLHGDFLLHSWFDNIDSGRLAFYYGIGGRIIFSDDAKFGARIPLGLNYILPDVPFDLFVEAVPILDLIPDLEFAGNGAVGARFYF